MKLTAEYLRERYWYDENCLFGFLRLKTASFTGKLKPGNVVGTLSSENSYVQLSINGRVYPVHRLIWLFKTGIWPTEVDHINGVRFDNCWKNLRNVTHQENTLNHHTSNAFNAERKTLYQAWLIACVLM